MLEEKSIIKIHSYKHDRTIHRVWNNVTVLKACKTEIVLGNYHSRVIESNGRYWDTKEPAICFFYEDKWFNIIAMLKDNGIHYYCNISSPCIYDDEAIKYIDYDLDLRVDPSYNYKILDKEEYRHHAEIMSYSDKLQKVIEETLNEVILMVKNQEGPFNHLVVYDYFNEYKKINEKLRSDYDETN